MQNNNITYPDYLYQITVGTIFTAYALYGYYIFLPILGLNEEGFFATTIFVFSFVPVFFFVKFTTEVLNGEFRKKRADKYIALKEEVAKLKAKGKYYPKSKYYLRVGWMLALLVLFVSITGLNAGMHGNEFFGIFFGAIPSIFMINFLYKKVLSGEDYRDMAKRNSKKIKKERVKQEVVNSETSKGKEIVAEPLIDEDGDIVLDNEKLAELGSYPNPKEQREGYVWSNAKDVFKASKDKGLYLDNFSLAPEVLDSLEHESEEDIKALSSVSTSISSLDLTRTLLLLGAMGSGKTETINSIVAQNFYNRAIINDIKGDFVEKFYRPNKDIILNLFDERSSYWDIFEEIKHNPEVVTAFIKNLVLASTGDDAKADFFAKSATKKFIDSFMSLAYMELTNIEKWDRLVDNLKKWIKEAGEGDNKTQSSISATMELAVEIFETITYRAKNGAKSFTITEFFSNQSGQKLFLLNNPAYSGKLTPYFTGFLGAVVSVILGRKDTKEDFTLTILDEFYSLNFDRDTKTKMLTMGRSKGMQLVIGTQYLDAKKDRQVLESSRFAMMVFTVADGETVKRVGEMMGQIEYKENSKSVSRNWGNGRGGQDNTGLSSATSILTSGKNYSHSEQVRNKKLLDEKKLQSMPKYHHITIIPSEKLVYLGYTKLVELEKTNENFVPIDLGKYYKFIHAGLQKGEGNSILKTSEKSDPLADYSEEELFVHWLRLTFTDKSQEEIDAYIEEYRLTPELLIELGKRFDEKEEVVKGVLERYTDEERLEMMDEFFRLGDKKKYQFCKDKKLIGAIIGLFMFSTDFTIEKTKQLIKGEL